MLALASRLPPERFAVDFLVLSGAGTYDQQAVAAGAGVRLLGTLPSSREPRRTRSTRWLARTGRYVRTVRRERYDVVDAWLYPTDVMAALLRPMTGTPVIVAGRRNVDPRGRLGRLDRGLQPIVRRLTDAVVANSQAAARHAIDNGDADAARTRIIRNGVLPIPAISDAERRERRLGLGVADGEILVGSVANLSRVKRLDRLVDAVAALCGEGLPVRLALFGEGPERPALERQVRRLGLERRVRLHGLHLEPESLYPAFDVVAQTSVREGLPNALLEAGSAGVAIVATDAGGTAEIVEDGRTGLLVPRDDPTALAGGLRRLIVDPGLRTRLAAEGRRHVLSAFGMDRFVGEFAALYEQLADAAGVRA